MISQKPGKYRFDLSMLLGSLLGLTVGFIIFSFYLFWIKDLTNVPEGHAETINQSLSPGSKLGDDSERKNADQVGISKNQEDSVVKDETKSLVELVHAVDEQYEQSGLQSLDYVIKEYKNPTIQNALTNLILQTSIVSIGYEQTLTEVLRETQGEVTTTVIRKLVNIWRQEAPTKLLMQLNKIEIDEIRTLAQHELATGWLNDDPIELLQHLDDLLPSVRVLVEAEAQMAVARISPNEAIADVLPNLNESHFEIEYFREVVQQLAKTDLEGAIDLVLNSEVLKFNTGPGLGDVQLTVLSDILGNFAKQEPEVAFAKAMEVKLNNERVIGPEVAVLAQIASADLEKALSLLSQVSDGGTANAATTVVGIACIKEQRFDKAIELGESLVDEARQEYYNGLFESWGAQSSETLLTALPTLPPDQRPPAAMRLMYANFIIPVLDDDQVNSLNAWLSESDRWKLKAYQEDIRGWRNIAEGIPVDDLIKFAYRKSDDLVIEIIGRYHSL